MNPMQKLVMMVKSIKNPQQAMMQMLANNTNPMAQNVLKMVQNGDTKGVEEFARNICKERGIDFDKEFSSFADNFK